MRKRNATSVLMDVDDAWTLVRAIRPEGGGVEYPLRVPYDPCPGLWLQVEADGSWQTNGELTDSARALLDLFLPLQARGRWVVGQMGVSLDGRIATTGGESHYITGSGDIERLHRLRALADAVVVGVGTVEADDPQLSVRAVSGDSPVRVVVDPGGRMSPDRRLVSDGGAPTFVIRASDTPAGPVGSAEIVRVPAPEGGTIPPRTIVEVLRERGMGRILVEGGGLTVSRFLEANLLDRLHVTVAPVILGSGRPAFTLPPVPLREALRPPCRHFRLGEDVLFELDFTDLDVRD